MDWGILPNTVALASVAVMGYLFGRSALKRPRVDANQLRCELKRARVVVDEMERITQEVRRSLASHHSCVVNFKDRLTELRGEGDARATAVCQEAERLLRPTLKLAAQMATAYDELRQQSCRLMSFTEVRTDVLTGLSNRRALDEAIGTLLAMKKRYRTQFAVAIFDIDGFKRVNEELGHVRGDAILKDVAQRFERCVRETDIVARYGGEEFVVVMPETDLSSACIVSRRLRRIVASETQVTISGGVTQAIDGDDLRTLLARANEALYGAKATSHNSIFLHNGTQLEPVTSLPAAPAAAEDTLTADDPQEDTLAPASIE
jgi:diguanylate cyclase (GGDEF)-like protein